jgi:hypothetical protein
MDIPQKLRQFLASILRKKEVTPISATPGSEVVEAEMNKKREIDWGLLCGVAAYVLTIASIFEPIRSWYFIAPVFFSAAGFVVLAIWRHCRTIKFVQTYRKLSFVLLISAVYLVFFGWAWKNRPMTSYDSARLHQMSNDELREAEKELAAKMREYQAEYNNRRPGVPPKKDSEKAWSEIIQFGNDFRSGFYRDYLGKAVAVRDEILWRLKESPEEAERGALAGLPLVLQSAHRGIPLSRALAGYIVGPEPVSDAAEFLDSLGRQLR